MSTRLTHLITNFNKYHSQMTIKYNKYESLIIKNLNRLYLKFATIPKNILKSSQINVAAEEIIHIQHFDIQCQTKKHNIY